MSAKTKRAVAVVIADPHWSTALPPEYRRERSNFQDVTAAKLAVVGAAAEELVVPILICGDLCDRSREFMDFWTLRTFLLEEYGDRRCVRLVKGQHDMFHHNAEDEATTFSAIVGDSAFDFDVLNDKPMALDTSKDIVVYGCSWDEEIPVPEDKDANNVLVIHKTMWHTTPVYPGQTEGNVGAMSVRLHELGYKVVFSGDNHKAFDCRVGGVDFHNVGALTRRDVTLANQRPRYIILFDDLSTESVYIGNEDVFDLGRSDADKGRDNDKDEFSAALAGGFSYDETFKGNLEKVAATGRLGDAVLTETQRNMLRDIVNAI